MRLLFFGYGNPGRGDDGLGPCCIQRFLEFYEGPDVETDQAFQLLPEDVDRICEFDHVVFVDAAYQDEDILYRQIDAEAHVSYTTHALSPSELMALAHTFYEDVPIASLLTLKGIDFSMRNSLSEEGEILCGKGSAFLADIAEDLNRKQKSNIATGGCCE